MEGKEHRAKISSKNQLTLPAGIGAFLHVGPGDAVHFRISGDVVTLTPAPVRQGLERLVGRRRVGTGLTREQVAGALEHVRGPRE